MSMTRKEYLDWASQCPSDTFMDAMDILLSEFIPEVEEVEEVE